MGSEMAGVGFGGAVEFGELRVNPVCHRGDLLRARGGHAFRRHFAGAQAGDDFFPHIAIVNKRGSIAILGKD